jgi:TRAP-type C4-dicarboxylate transport system permease small subunit
MNQFLSMGRHLSKFLDVIGGAVLAGMMFLTVFDVAMRYLGIPFMGAYELVSMAGAVVIGFGLPQTTLDDGNVKVDFLIESAPKLVKKLFFVFTKLLGITLFAVMGYGLIAKAMELQAVNEASLTLRMPLFPVGYGLGVCALIESLALSCVLLKGLYQGGSNE